MTIIELYDTIGGDWNELMRRILYEDMAVELVKKYAKVKEFDHMIEAYKKKDYRQVFEISHNIKGMTGTLSMKALTDTISTICESVRNGEPTIDLDPLIKQAKAEQALLINLIEKLD